MRKYIYLFLLLLIIDIPAIAGTIHSYTLKSPPDDADEIVIYDSGDGSTKKIEVGDISSIINWSSVNSAEIQTAGINWSSVINSEIQYQGINWSSTNLFVNGMHGNIGIGSATPGAKLDIFSGSIRAIGIGTTVPQQLCRKSDGTFGYFNGAWSGTCN